MANLEVLDNKAKLDSQANKVLQVVRGHGDLLDYRALAVLLVSKALLDRKVVLVLVVYRDLRVQLVPQGLPEQKAYPVHRVILDLMDQLEHQVLPVRPDHRALKVYREELEHQA